MGPLSIPYSRYLVGPLPWYSFLIILGAALAVILAVKEEKRLHLPKDTIIDLALYAIPFGILGARIYYVLFSWDSFKDHPLSVLRIWEGGIAIYGAVIAGFIVILVFCRIRRLPILSVCDAVVPGLALAQCIGRWGNYFNMEAYGLPLHSASLCFFPLAVQIPSGEGGSWHMASFFYESLLNLGIFLFLWNIGRRKFRRRGDSFFFYLFLYGAGRLVIEETRMDSLYSSGIRISQLLSAVLCLFVLIRYAVMAVREGRLFGFSGWIVLLAGMLGGLCNIIWSLWGHLWEPVPYLIRLGLPAAASLIMTLSFFGIYFCHGGKENADNQNQKP